MKTKRRLKDWVWLTIAIATILGAILASGLIEKWL